MIDTVRLIASLALIHSLAAALPVKREIITRMYTAPTHTNLDVYSTTTRVHIAPTVEYIVDGDVTYTTTLVPSGVDSSAQPSTSTIYGNTASTTAAQPSSSQAATSSQWSPPVSSSQAPTSSSQAPTSSSQAPTSSSEAPTSSSQAPTSSSEAPTSSSQAPTSSSEAPTSSSQAPTSSSQGWTSSTWGSSSSLPTSSYASSSSVWTSSSSSLISSSSWTSSSSLTTSSSSSSYSSSTSQASTSSDNGGLIAVPTAVTYSPYNSDSSCKTSDEVKSDLQIILSRGITNIRLYGTECDSLDTVLPNASDLGFEVNQGLWISSDGVDSIDDAVESLIQYGQQNGWDVFSFITIGNEAINSGYCSVSDLISKIQSVKSQLSDAGYEGLVTTSEPPVSFENYPKLCTESGIDFVGINPHSYFDADITATLSGQFLQSQVELTQTVCPNMDIFITETGYPYNGDQNGEQIPSEENQRAAINSILEVVGTNVTILSYFDDSWKQPGDYDIEQYFGIEDLFS